MPAPPVDVAYAAWDTINQQYIAGDAANHTVYLIKSGTKTVAINSGFVTDLGDGDYSITIEGTEAIAGETVMSVVSTTPGVIIPKKTVRMYRMNELAYAILPAPGSPESGNHILVDHFADPIVIVDGARESTSQSILAALGTIGATVWGYANRTLTAFGFPVALTAETEAQVDAIEAKAKIIGTGMGLVHSPVNAVGEIPGFVRGDDYTADINRALEWGLPASKHGDFTGGSATFLMSRIGCGTSVAIGPIVGAILDAGGEAQRIQVQLTGADLSTDGRYKWEVQAKTAAGRTITPYSGVTTVAKDLIQ